MSTNAPLRMRMSACLVALIGGWVAVAPAGTLEENLPRESLIALSWDSLLDPTDSTTGQAAQLVAVLRESGDDDMVAVAPLVDLAVRAAQAPGAIALLDVVPGEQAPDVQLVGCLKLGPKAAEFASSLDAWIAGQDPSDHGSATLRGVDFKYVALPDGPHRLYWAAKDGYFLAGISPRGLERLLEQVGGGGATLASSDELQLAYRKAKVEPGTATFLLHADAAAMLAKLRGHLIQREGALPPMFEPLVKALGLDALRSKTVLIAETDVGALCYLFAHVVGERRGLLKLWDQAPLTDDDLTVFPADAYWVQTGNLDLTRLWKDVLDVVESLAPDAVPQVEAVAAMGTTFLGFSIIDQVLPALGDTWAIYDSPSHGGLLGTGTVAVVEARDPAMLGGVLTHLVEIANSFLARSEVKLVVGKSKLGEHEVTHVTIAGAPSPFLPSWGFAKGRMVLGLMPQSVAAALGEIERGTRAQSVLSRKDVQTGLSRLSLKSYQSFGFTDTPYFARMLYPLEVLYANAVCSMLAKTPDAALAFTPPVDQRVTESFARVGLGGADEEGIIWQSIGTFEGGGLTVSAAAVSTSILLPSLSRARYLAKRTVSMSNLRGIGAAMMIYANEHNEELPADFDVLLRAGSVTQEMLVSPLAERGQPSYRIIQGLAVSGKYPYATTVAAYEVPSSDEGTNVLFLDGHVEWVTLDRFRELVRATYTALGRESEIPEEAR